MAHDIGFAGLFSLEDDPAPPSGIDELQSALGSILLAQEEKLIKPSDAPAQYHAPIENKWTGTFSLFAFPRELRDEIYYHYLYRQQSALYDRTSLAQWPFSADNEVISLLLTCTQVYHEAIEIFHRYNQVETSCLPRLGAGPEKLLNSFPAIHAQQLQKFQMNYGDYQPAYLLDRPMRHFPGECWQMMIRDAYFVKTYFPKLRLFTARWHCDAEYFSRQEGMVFTNKTEEQKVQIWLDWMRFSSRKMKALPPQWMKIKFEPIVERYRGTCMHTQQSSIDEALTRFTAEVAAGLEGNFDVLGHEMSIVACKEMFRLDNERRKTGEWGRF